MEFWPQKDLGCGRLLWLLSFSLKLDRVVEMTRFKRRFSGGVDHPSIQFGEGGISPEARQVFPMLWKTRASFLGLCCMPCMGGLFEGPGGHAERPLSSCFMGSVWLAGLRPASGWRCTISRGWAELDSEPPSWGRTEGR